MAIYLAASQAENSVAYRFRATDIGVYTVEEAAYHVYIYWQDCGDEVFTPEFLAWVRECAGLPRLAAKIAELGDNPQISVRIIGFLSLFEFYDETHLGEIRASLQHWEARKDWERLKEQGDALYNNGRPQKAVALYRRALAYGENFKILNNYAMALMRLNRFDEAAALLERAVAQEPSKLRLWLALAESYIRGRNFEAGEAALERSVQFQQEPQDEADIEFLQGLTHLEKGAVRQALVCFQNALEKFYEPHYVYSLAQTHAKLRAYDKAAETLAGIKEKDRRYYMALAGIHRAAGNIPAAIRAAEQAIGHPKNSKPGSLSSANLAEECEVWAKLAHYHRLDYDLPKAEAAAMRALSLDSGYERAKFELACIRKSQGQTREYQSTLASILRGFKNGFREG